MDGNLREQIQRLLNGRVQVTGFAPVDRFQDAPEKHHPARICKDAATVIVFGVNVPKGMLHSPDYSLYALHRTYHSVYPELDDIALELSNFIEAASGALAVPVPAFAPLVYRGREPWGILSLKHAAVMAGLGSFGRNGLMHSPEHGAMLRLGAVVTSAGMAGDPVIEAGPCPPGCKACFNSCPQKAFDDDGRFSKMTCLSATIKHAIYPLALKDAAGLKHIERVVNTAGQNYWLSCNECLKVCPNNLPKKKSASSMIHDGAGRPALSDMDGKE